MSATRRWIIVSNRLPFELDDSDELRPASGGLVTAVKGIEHETPALWVGSAPDGLTPERWDELRAGLAEAEDDPMGYEPIFLEDNLYDRYYNGLCNDVLWPLLHYEPRYVRFTRSAWEAYVEVNERFADAIAAAADDDDLVWVHDFHLFLLPMMLRERRPDLRIGFFLHVPFPSSELFRQLPVREELLRSLLQADLVGFHDYDYLRHFCAALRGILGVDSNLLSVKPDDERERTTQLGVFPVGINTTHFRETATSSPVQALYRRHARNLQVDRLILGVDRLDYMKGIDLKLDAFQAMLEAHPEWRDRVRLLQIAVPSRTDVPEYVRLRERIERRVGEINGRYGSPDAMPVHYIFSTVPFDELIALYRLADVLLVTSKRDGMNLVAQEYVVTQPTDDPGVLVLSEFAGAISVLSQALRINPWDVERTSARLHQALTMSVEERTSRHRPMLAWLEGYTASTWANSFVRALDSLPPSQPNHAQDALAASQSVLARLSAPRLLTLLDYDGTLAPICDTPAEATLCDDMRERLRRLATTEGVDVVIVSGRDQDFLDAQLADLPVGVAAEHGAFFRPAHAPGEPHRAWRTLVTNGETGWRDVVSRLFEDFTARTPDSFIETKHYGLAWHYRRSPERFAHHQARKLLQELGYALSNQPATVIDGDKVVEARAMQANKGAFFHWLAQEQSDYDAVLAVGDDATDEDLFAALPDDAVAVRVGDGSTCAGYRLDSQAHMSSLLELVQTARGGTPSGEPDRSKARVLRAHSSS